MNPYLKFLAPLKTGLLLLTLLFSYPCLIAQPTLGQASSHGGEITGTITFLPD